jgi:hypothetical protein
MEEPLHFLSAQSSLWKHCWHTQQQKEKSSLHTPFSDANYQFSFKVPCIHLHVYKHRYISHIDTFYALVFLYIISQYICRCINMIFLMCLHILFLSIYIDTYIHRSIHIICTYVFQLVYMFGNFQYIALYIPLIKNSITKLG